MANANAQQLYTDLQAAGLSVGASLGIVGNILAESNARPLAVGDSGTSHGIAQWRNERWDKLVAWAKNRGKNPNTFDTQSAYLVQDLQTMNDGHMWANLARTKDTYDASLLILQHYERPKGYDTPAAVGMAKARGDLAIGAGLTNGGSPLVTADPQALQSDTSGTATATGGQWQGFKLPSLPDMDWKTWGVKALFLVLGLALILAGLLQLTGPTLEKAAKVAI